VESGIAGGKLRRDLDIDAAVFFLDALMDRFLQAYCVSFLDAGSGLYQASPKEMEQRVGEFVQLVKRGMGTDGI
jgi:hypothetical protein